MAAPRTMRAAVEEYLGSRRALGFALHIEGHELLRFARFAEQVGHTGALTTALAMRWATRPAAAEHLYHARRLDMVRRLARHLAVDEPATEIPPAGLLGPSYRRRAPHIYADDEVAALLSLAAQLGPTGGLRPHTYTTLFGLLACTGLRISEALRLGRADVDPRTGIVTIAAGKFHRSRLVPLHPTATRALAAYADRRDRYRPRPRADTFFVSEHGTSLKYLKVLTTFVDLRRRLEWQPSRDGRLPRIHDMRHTFVVRQLQRWYTHEGEVDRQIASLATYLGHVKVSDTYWYVTAVPELLAASAARFEQAVGRTALGGPR